MSIPLQLVTPPTHLYKKLDEFGQGYDKQIKKNGRKDKKLLAEKNALERETDFRPSSVTCTKPFKLTVDNVYYYQTVHHMTEDYKNIDVHCVKTCEFVLY